MLHIVMEYADGGDLQQLIRERKSKKLQFSENEVMEIFIQLCQAVGYLHDKRILHRDLKSQNVFMTKTGLVR